LKIGRIQDKIGRIQDKIGRIEGLGITPEELNAWLRSSK